MASIKRFQLKKPVAPSPITADAGPDIPGGEGANKGFWRRQWRDREGKFIKMGHSLKFTVKTNDGKYVTATGKFKGTTEDGQYARVLIKHHPTLPDGYYNVASKNGEQVLATIELPGGDHHKAIVSPADMKAAQNINEMSYQPEKVATLPEGTKPQAPSPAMIKPQKPQVAPTAPITDKPSATTAKPEIPFKTMYDRDKKPMVKDDKVTFHVKDDNGQVVKVEGTYTGTSVATFTGEHGGSPILRVRDQWSLPDGDYPINMGVINLDPTHDRFDASKLDHSSALESLSRINDVFSLTPLTEEQSQALYDYTTGNGFEDIRSLLSKHPGITLDKLEKLINHDEELQKVIEDVKKIEDAIYASPLPEDKTLYRGIEILDDAHFNAAYKALKVGEPIHDASLQSTSASLDIAERFTGGQGIIFEITAPKGSPAFEVAPFHAELSQIEHEFMLPRNSQLTIDEIGKPEPITTSWGASGTVVRVKVSYQPPTSRSEPSKPSVQIEPPKYNVLNSSQVSAKGSNIIVPDSSEADALAQIGKDPTPEQIAALEGKTKPLFTTNPENYTPFNPDQGVSSSQAEMLNTLTPTGEAVYQYIDSSLKLNKALRLEDAAVETSDQVKHMDEAIRISSHLPPGATVYRMMKLERWMKLNLKSGQVVFDKGYMSTTMTKDYVDAELKKNEKANQVKQVPMRIVMPQNTAGLDVTSISWFNQENEYLLPRNTGLRFLGWDANGFAVFERVT